MKFNAMYSILHFTPIFLKKIFLVFFCDIRLLYTLVRGYCHTFDALTNGAIK